MSVVYCLNHPLFSRKKFVRRMSLDQETWKREICVLGETVEGWVHCKYDGPCRIQVIR
jgi:hypothetical protein